MIEGGGFYVLLAYGAAYFTLLVYGLRLFARLRRLRADDSLRKDAHL